MRLQQRVSHQCAASLPGLYPHSIGVRFRAPQPPKRGSRSEGCPCLSPEPSCSWLILLSGGVNSAATWVAPSCAHLLSDYRDKAPAQSNLGGLDGVGANGRSDFPAVTGKENGPRLCRYRPVGTGRTQFPLSGSRPFRNPKLQALCGPRWVQW